MFLLSHKGHWGLKGRLARCSLFGVLWLAYQKGVNQISKVAKNTSVIEINGNKYDAVTGQVVGAVRRVADQVKPATGVIDGFIRRPSTKRAPRADGSPKAQNITRQLQKSKTLMRRAVAKPKMATESNLRARSPGPKPGQLLRAKVVAQSTRVSRFSNPLNSNRSMRHDAVSGQVLPPSAGGSRGAATTAATVPSLVASISSSNLERLLDDALFKADSHREMLRRQLAGNGPIGRIKLMPKWLSIGSSLLVVLLLGAFFAWQNIPQVSMRLAANKAHVSAAVPAYTPTGFKFASPVSSTAKAVTIQYKAGTDNSQKFSISQQASNWDSSTLASTVGSKSSQVQTAQVNGNTVYIYGSSNNATWVNHGVLNTLTDQAGLTSDQILKIAGSMQ